LIGAVVIAVATQRQFAFSEQPYRADDAAMAMIFSFRETSQMHLLAHALGTASINGTPADEVVKHCDRAIEGFEAVSVPMLRKYLANVTHDPQSRETFAGITELQQRVLAEMRAVKAMADSGNGRDERLAFVAANRGYNEIAQTVAASMVQPGQTGGDAPAGQAPADGADRSPNKAIFTDDEWAGVVAGLQKRGLLRDPKDAKAYFGTFALLKSVFVQKRINEPTTGQLFALAKVLNVAFGQMAPEKIETTLRTILQLAKETSTEVASRQTLLDLEE
jgi:hypothetical protein